MAVLLARAGAKQHMAVFIRLFLRNAVALPHTPGAVKSFISEPRKGQRSRWPLWRRKRIECHAFTMSPYESIRCFVSWFTLPFTQSVGRSVSQSVSQLPSQCISLSVHPSVRPPVSQRMLVMSKQCVDTCLILRLTLPDRLNKTTVQESFFKSELENVFFIILDD